MLGLGGGKEGWGTLSNMWQASSLPLPYLVEYKNALLIILFDKSPFYLYVMLLVDLT